jgi:hypothetical protein
MMNNRNAAAGSTGHRNTLVSGKGWRGRDEAVNTDLLLGGTEGRDLGSMAAPGVDA